MESGSSSDRSDLADSDLCSLAQEGDHDALSELVVRHIPLALYLARLQSGRPSSLDDRRQQASEALVRAALSYDPSRISFRLWAQRQIKWELANRSIDDAPIRIPPHVYRHLGQVDRWRERTQVTDRQASIALDLDPSATEMYRQAVVPVASLDTRDEASSHVSAPSDPPYVVATAVSARLSDLPWIEAATLLLVMLCGMRRRDVARLLGYTAPRRAAMGR